MPDWFLPLPSWCCLYPDYPQCLMKLQDLQIDEPTEKQHPCVSWAAASLDGTRYGVGNTAGLASNFESNLVCTLGSVCAAINCFQHVIHFFAACQVRWRTGCAFCVCVVWDRGRVIFLQKVQSSIGLRRTQLIVQSCSNRDFSSEGSEFYWVRNMYNLSGWCRASKSGVLECMIYWVACAGRRSLPRWCPTAASVSLHPSSTPQGRQRYQSCCCCSSTTSSGSEKATTTFRCAV